MSETTPAPDLPVNPLIAAAGAALLGAAAAREIPWTQAHLEWSQAGPQHSGRAYLMTDSGIQRIDLPDGAVNALARLRQEQATPVTGAWLSCHVSVTPAGEITSTASWNDRPYWNASGLRMVPDPQEAPPASPVPSDEQWLADLRTFPRSAENIPEWLRSSTAQPGAAAAALRRRLAEANYPLDAVVLPDALATPTTLEGAMEIRGTSGGRFAVGVRDYGTFEVLHTASSERAACDWLWDYLLAGTPQPRPTTRADLEQRSAAYRPAYAQVYAQIQAGGGAATVTTLGPGVALDRIGSIDGVFLFPWGTPLPARSLPPTTSPAARLYQVVTTRALYVEAEIVPAWFGQPGGSLRFRIAQDGLGVRQLLQQGALIEVAVSH